MTEILHVLGLCPDSNQHISLFKALLASSNELSYVYHYIKYLFNN